MFYVLSRGLFLDTSKGFPGFSFCISLDIPSDDLSEILKGFLYGIPHEFLLRFLWNNDLWNWLEKFGKLGKKKKQRYDYE